MCLAIPGKVVSIDENIAVVDMMGNQRSADITLLEDVKIGDFVLVHAGFGIQKLDPDEAVKTLEAFEELEQAMEEHGMQQ